MSTLATRVEGLCRPRICARTFDFAREVAVMVIVNRTPDSFFDRGATFALDKALAAANDGAAIDVGGVPFAGRQRRSTAWCRWSRRDTPLRMC